MSRSAKPHYRNRVDASVSGGERETPAADDEQERDAARRKWAPCIGNTSAGGMTRRISNSVAIAMREEQHELARSLGAGTTQSEAVPHHVVNAAPLASRLGSIYRRGRPRVVPSGIARLSMAPASSSPRGRGRDRHRGRKT